MQIKNWIQFNFKLFKYLDIVLPTIFCLSDPAYVISLYKSETSFTGTTRECSSSLNRLGSQTIEASVNAGSLRIRKSWIPRFQIDLNPTSHIGCCCTAKKDTDSSHFQDFTLINHWNFLLAELLSERKKLIDAKKMT